MVQMGARTLHCPLCRLGPSAALSAVFAGNHKRLYRSCPPEQAENEAVASSWQGRGKSLLFPVQLEKQKH